MTKFFFIAGLLFCAGVLQAEDRFTLHKDSYWMFVSGHGDKTLPLQFSGKYKVIDFKQDGAEGSGFYIAHTSRLYWDMYNAIASWPIYDVNHLPEGFVRWLPDRWGSGIGLKWLEAGYRHHSNGGGNVPDPQDPGDLLTKSYFQAFVRSQQEWTGEQLRLRAALEGRAYHIDWENPDISDYLGRYALELDLDFRLFKLDDGSYLLQNNTLFFRTESSVFHELRSRHPRLDSASRFSFKAGAAVDLMTALRAVGMDGGLSLFVLFHQGYGEYLSTYNDFRDNRIYFGFSIRPERSWLQ